MTEKDTKKISFLLIGNLIIVLGYIFSNGFYFVQGLFLIAIAFLLLLLFHKIDFVKMTWDIDMLTLVKLNLVLFVSLSLIMYGGFYQNNSHYLVTLSKILLIVAAMFSFLYIFNFSKWLPFFSKFKFWFLFLVALFLRLFMTWSSPSPYIDVFSIQRIAPRALLEGNNPYSIIYPQMYKGEISDVYSYGPGVILMDAPAVLLTGDPRYTMVLAEIGTGFLIYLILGYKNKLGSNKTLQEILPLVFLYNPRSLFIIEQAWVDPLLIFLITLFVSLLFIWKKNLWAFMVLGVAVATKQYTVFLLPFLFNGKFLKLRNAIVVVGVFAIITIPFLLWNFKDFLRDVVLYQLTIQRSRYDSLSFNSLFYNLTGSDIPKGAVVLFNLFVLTYLLRAQKKLVASSVMLSASVLSLSTFLIYRLAFIHYYYFASSLLFLSIVLIAYESVNGSKPSKINVKGKE